jgi:isopentenyl-diphosphate Delta-isomerase
MANPSLSDSNNHDPNAENRKKDHINLALQSSVNALYRDTRFYYEPLLSGHPIDRQKLKLNFLGKELGAPLWISSMTGGTAHAKTINENLAKACGEYKLGMGLGSCRQLLHSDQFLSDFAVRKYLGDQPLYANLGIAQIEAMVKAHTLVEVKTLLDKLEADGLIIHVNPLQEWLQPEGDRYYDSPIDTIRRVMEELDIKIIVKEVGQGMGPRSLLALLNLPIQAIDLAAIGGTNFASLEILRSDATTQDTYGDLTKLGHHADEMVEMINNFLTMEDNHTQSKQIIISGGVRNFLDGYYLTQKCGLPSIYGQASALLHPAIESYEKLQQYIESQLDGLALAHSLLKVKHR